MQKTFVCVQWIVGLCAMTHLFVCHDSDGRPSGGDVHLDILIYSKWSWCIHKCAVNNFFTCHDSGGYGKVTVKWTDWQTQFDMTYSRAIKYSSACYGAALCVPWLRWMARWQWYRQIGTVWWTHSHVCHDSFCCVPWLILCVSWLRWTARWRWYRQIGTVRWTRKWSPRSHATIIRSHTPSNSPSPKWRATCFPRPR